MTHAERAHQYALDVTEKRIPACKWVRLACQRHLDDLKRAELADWPYRFDAEKGNRVCKFIELLPHVEGEWAARKERIRLEPWQCFKTCSIFGWVKKSDGKRRFRKASLYEPRKNAKSTWAGGVGLWMFAKDGEHGAQIYSGATTEAQAWKVFGPAREMVKKSPKMQEGLGIEVNAQSLVIDKSFSKFEPIIGKPGDGDSPHLAIIDEYHEHADPLQYNTMKTGMGARSQPLLLVISTAGDNLSGPCRDDWRDCEKILERSFEDETHFCVIWTIDGDGEAKNGDDWTTEAALAKANPNWRVSVHPDGYLQEQKNAARDPKKQADFKTKHLNMWVSAASGWLNMLNWNKCATLTREQFFSEYAGRTLDLGLDAASKVDMTSLSGNVRLSEKECAIFNWHFIPEETAQKRENEHYRKWIAEGWLTATPGARIDFTVIEEKIRELTEQFNVRSLNYDPKELNDFVNRVKLWAGFDVVEINQSPTFISEPMKELEAQVESGTLKHCGDPVLTWMASNVVKKKAMGGGPVKYYYPGKEKDQNKIDGIVAAIMAMRHSMMAPADFTGSPFWMPGDPVPAAK